MIILTGPDQHLKARLWHLLRGDNYEPPDTYRTDLRWLVHRVHIDHRNEVGEFVHNLPDGDAARYMLGMALASAGSLVVLCKVTKLTEVWNETFGGTLPFVHVTHDENKQLKIATEQIVDAWRSEIAKANPLYDYHSTGGHSTGGVMLVGEANKEDGWPIRRAFINDTGCSLFLHQALQKNQGVRYYLTNANKTNVHRYNRAALIDELEILKPRKVVAMGTEAAKMLSDLKVAHERTYHPQYWKRFKNKDLDEFAQALK